MLTAPHPVNPCARRRDRPTALSRWNFENYTVVASRSWRNPVDAPRLKPGCPKRACRFNSCRAHKRVSREVRELAHASEAIELVDERVRRTLEDHFAVSSVRDGIWETCRIQTPVPAMGVQVRFLPDVHTRVVGEIAYHSWLLPLNSGFDSRAAHRRHAPLAELG
jgi:hypothetical protein